MNVLSISLSLLYGITMCAADMSQPGSLVTQTVTHKKTWSCFCYSRCFARLCKRFSPLLVVPIDQESGKEQEPSHLVTRASHHTSQHNVLELRKRGSSSAAAERKNPPPSPTRAHTPLPLLTVDGKRLSPVPNPSYEPLPGLSIDTTPESPA